jgi:hypothetical protein
VQEGAVVDHHTPVLDNLKPGMRQSLGHRRMPDAGVHPHRLGPLGQDVRHVAGQIGCPAEDIDQVHRDGDVDERAVDLVPQDGR